MSLTVCVSSLGDLTEFYSFKFQTELLYKKNPKLLNQFQYCEKELVPFIVIVGEEEKANGGVKIRDVQTRQEVKMILLFSCVHGMM